MNTSIRSAGRLLGAALRALLVLTVLVGVIYPLVVWGVAQAAFHNKANGSEVKADGKVVGSGLLGQNFFTKDGKPDPKWFQSRPSAAGDGYDPTSTGASNLAADSPELTKSVKERKQQVAAFNGVPESKVPADAVTASGSGLDPDISPQYAAIQTARVAKANGLTTAQVDKLVKDHTDGRQLGFLGNPTVNVLELNIALKELDAR
ncbi:potassium-transporting ATPase subunit KdpC [Streptomyces sp. NPDC001070]